MDFARAEVEFGRLKAQFETGGLTEAEFKARLQELMIEDDQGRWWMIGYETGKWYVHDGEKWLAQEPPRAGTVSPQPEPAKQVTAQPAPESPSGAAATALPAPGARVKLGRDAVSVLLISIGWLISLGAGGFIAKGPWENADFPGLGLTIALAGAIAGLITGLVLRFTEPHSPWKQVVLPIVGWAATGVPFAIDVRGSTTYPAEVVLAASVGLVSGLMTALAVKWMRPSMPWRNVGIITAGWFIGWAIGIAIFTASVGAAYGDAGVLSRAFAEWGVIAGVAGSSVTVWQMRRARPASR